MARTRRPIKYATPRTPKQKAIRITFHVLVWFGAAILYYVGFSLFFDTPVEYELKHSTDQLRDEYTRLEARYDSLRTVMENVSERDRNVFNILFESDPYDFDTEYETKRLATYESLLDKSDRQIILELKEKVRQSEATLTKLNESYLELQRLLDTVGDGRNRIPAIQPVINQQLTLLTASYGMRIHPFYRTLQSHQGVDYTVPEGSRVFATADGRVKEIATRSTAGRTIVIDHGNGYETSYSHLLAVNVRRGQEVRRGDIIGLSGNTGLSIAPHLHYEVRHNGMRVDPIHYSSWNSHPSSTSGSSASPSRACSPSTIFRIANEKETAIYPSHRKLLGTTLAAAIMTTLSCLLVIVQPHGKVGLGHRYRGSGSSSEDVSASCSSCC